MNFSKSKTLFMAALVLCGQSVLSQAADISVSPAGTIVPNGARQLAAQCFQCHGTNGHSQTDIDSLAGESERELIEEMLEMQSDKDNGLMEHQARGYTETEIRAIAAYIASVSGENGGDKKDKKGKHDDDDD